MFCQFIFLLLLFYNILSIISENILGKFACYVQKNKDLLQQAENTLFLLYTPRYELLCKLKFWSYFFPKNILPIPNHIYLNNYY